MSTLPKDCYLDLFGLNDNFTFKYGDYPDLYVICLQEQGYSLDEIILPNKWLECFKNFIKRLHQKTKINYLKLFFKRESGLVSMVFCKKEISHLFRNYDFRICRTSLLGLIALKGAIIMKFDLLNVPISITNCHLSAHDYNYEKRLQEYQTIKETYFKNNDNLFSSDYTFCLGDLNFRIENLNFEQTINKIEKKNFNPISLLNHDQLIKAQTKKQAFHEFDEGKIHFKPTFKKIIGSKLYDKKRVPSYCDRILYCFKKNGECYVNLKIYDSIETYNQSDHKPVFALFDINLNLKNYSNLNGIKLMTKSPWILNNNENVFIYKPKCKKVGHSETDNVRLTYAEPSFSSSENLTEHIRTNWDWIGLFKEYFYDIDEYLAFVYIDDIPVKNKNQSTFLDKIEKGMEAIGLEDSQEAEDTEISKNILDNSDNKLIETTTSTETCGEILNENFECLTVMFSDQAVCKPGKYKLVYVNENGCIESISNSFEVIEN